MTFLNPILLSVGLGCIAIPIIIHILMRRRRRPVAWGAMKFLLEAYRRQRRRMNLEQILLLASRCLLVALLALAVGKPVLGAAKSLLAGPRTLFLVVDNSITSTTKAPNATDDALSRSKAAATDLISKLDASKGDRVAIIAAASPADPIVFPPSSDLAGARDVLKELAPADSKADLAASLTAVRDELLAKRPDTASIAGSNAIVALLSEFRAGSADPTTTLPAFDAESVRSLRVLASPPPAETIDNVAVVALEPLRSLVLSGDAGTRTTGVDVPVRVTLRRFGPGNSNAGVSRVRVTASLAGTAPTTKDAAAVGDARWAPNQETTQVIITATAPARASDRTASRIPLILTATIDNDAIAADNTFRRTIDTRDRLEVALLTAQPIGQATTIDAFHAEDWLALAIAPAEDVTQRRQSGDVRVTTIDPAQASSLGRGLTDFDVLVVPRPDLLDTAAWRGLRAAADAGSLILVTPPTAVETHLWTDAFVDAMGLEWSFPREARVIEPRLTVAPERPTPSGPDLLELVAAEIPELAKPVTVAKLLAPTSANTEPSSTFDTLLKLTDGSPFVIAAPAGGKSDTSSPTTAPSTSSTTPARKPLTSAAPTRGLVVYLAASPDLSWTDLPTKPLMVPLIQELVRQGVGRSGGPRSAIAGTPLPLPSNAAELARLTTDDSPTSSPSTLTIAPSAAPPSLRAAGLWSIRNPAGNTVGVLAINPDTAGSATELRTTDELTRWLAPVAGSGNAITWLNAAATSTTPTPAGTTPNAATSTASPLSLAPRDLPPVSFPLLIAAGIMALIELALSRFFSHARADQWTSNTPTQAPSKPVPTTSASPSSNAA